MPAAVVATGGGVAVKFTVHVRRPLASNLLFPLVSPVVSRMPFIGCACGGDVVRLPFLGAWKVGRFGV